MKALLIANESDVLNLGRRYKTVTTRMQAGQELRIERDLLLDELERLTGVRTISVDKVIGTTSDLSHKPEDDNPKEPVHA